MSRPTRSRFPCSTPRKASWTFSEPIFVPFHFSMARSFLTRSLKSASAGRRLRFGRDHPLVREVGEGQERLRLRGQS